MKIKNLSNGKKQITISKQEWLDAGKLFLKAQNLELVKKLDDLDEREISRGLRDAIAAEIGAIKQYEALADSIPGNDHNDIKKVLQDIANEEKNHIGELQALLNNLLDDEEKLLEDGKKEVEELLGEENNE